MTNTIKTKSRLFKNKVFVNILNFSMILLLLFFIHYTLPIDYVPVLLKLMIT